MASHMRRHFAPRVLRRVTNPFLPAQAVRNFAATAAEGANASVPKSKWLAGVAFGATAVALVKQSLNPISAEEEDRPVDWYINEVHKRLCSLEIERAERVSSAFVFIKPHAVTDAVKQLVNERFAAQGITVLSEGTIPSEKIDKDMLIDTHYGAIAARAMKQKPAELAVSQKAQDEFKKTFGLSWGDALKKGVVYNLVDGAAKLGCSYAELGDKYDTLKKGPAGPGTTMLKFGGGFYCGKLRDDVYVINGFYARMRSQFTIPGECIHYYEVQWESPSLSWGDFRGKVLGGTDPMTADDSSLRNQVFRMWKQLGLASEPNTGNNGLHASASPFEALAERANWLGVPLKDDYFGKAMLAKGVPLATIKAWSDDPAVQFQGKKQSLFDLLEDLDGRECLKKSEAIKAAN